MVDFHRYLGQIRTFVHTKLQSYRAKGHILNKSSGEGSKGLFQELVTSTSNSSSRRRNRGTKTKRRMNEVETGPDQQPLSRLENFEQFHTLSNHKANF